MRVPRYLKAIAASSGYLWRWRIHTYNTNFAFTLSLVQVCGHNLFSSDMWILFFRWRWIVIWATAFLIQKCKVFDLGRANACLFYVFCHLIRLHAFRAKKNLSFFGFCLWLFFCWCNQLNPQQLYLISFFSRKISLFGIVDSA